MTRTDFAPGGGGSGLLPAVVHDVHYNSPDMQHCGRTRRSPLTAGVTSMRVQAQPPAVGAS